MRYPLEGIRVLDFSRVVSAPFATRMLADLGADVVKVEPPDGDSTRTQGKNIGGIAGMYLHHNAGKRNVCMDLRAEGAIDLVKSLVAHADIVVENYRPGVMRRLGIDYERLKEVKPDLIMLSISGYGQSGPESERAAYAPVVHAEVGMMHHQGTRNNAPFGDPPVSLGDTNAGLHGAVAILAALQMRHQTGLGQYIDMAMMDASFFTDDRVHFALDDLDDSLPEFPVIDLPFGRIVFATNMQMVFRQLHRLAGMPDPAVDEEDLNTKVRLREDAIGARLSECRDIQEFSDLMDALNIAWGEVRSPRDVHNQPTLVHREMIAQIDDRAGGTRPVQQSPYRFSNARSGVRGPAPHKGEHNFEALTSWLSLSDSEIARLQDAGIVVESKQNNT